ncbi:hypothetical protein HPP92_004251 [Vanilla planifolia]|uniref:Uncharacterized protein n=1 Tax=Vanilla planifolia TaxID=51239 RepID=A0A835S3B3_VANPL|nr:hypothetical protein HPP92_004251 [Vanilla planifolia]
MDSEIEARGIGWADSEASGERLHECHQHRSTLWESLRKRPAEEYGLGRRGMEMSMEFAGENRHRVDPRGRLLGDLRSVYKV